MQLLNEISIIQTFKWPVFSSTEIYNAINKYSSFSILGLDHISWSYLKRIVSDWKYITNIVNIANIYINLSYWLSHFKKSTFIVILKPNKLLYNNPKIF